MAERRRKEVTEKIIGCAFGVSNVLGCGFLEKVYVNALAHELRNAGLFVEPIAKAIQQKSDGRLDGNLFPPVAKLQVPAPSLVFGNAFAELYLAAIVPDEPCIPTLQIIRFSHGDSSSFGDALGDVWRNYRLKSSRGDRRWTFPNDLGDGRLFQLAIAQMQEFSADAFFELGNASS